MRAQKRSRHHKRSGRTEANRTPTQRKRMRQKKEEKSEQRQIEVDETNEGKRCDSMVRGKEIKRRKISSDGRKICAKDK